MALEGLSPFRCERVADGGPLSMADSGMNVINPSGHRLNWGSSGVINRSDTAHQ